MHIYKTVTLSATLSIAILTTTTLYSLENAGFETAQQSKNVFLPANNLLNSFVQGAHAFGVFKLSSLPFAGLGLGALGLNTFLHIGQLNSDEKNFTDALRTDPFLCRFIHAMQLPSYRRTISCAALTGVFYMLHNNTLDKLLSPGIKNSIALTTLSCASILLYKIVKDFINAPAKQIKTKDPISSSTNTTETEIIHKKGQEPHPLATASTELESAKIQLKELQKLEEEKSTAPNEQNFNRNDPDITRLKADIITAAKDLEEQLIKLQEYNNSLKNK